jgi:endothelin-converting enzyme/putative endopeptidase
MARIRSHFCRPSTAIVAVALLGFLSGHAPTLAGDAAKPALGSFGVETRSLKRSIRPGDDFYRYVNQGWIDIAVIPTGYPAIDEGTVVELRTGERVKGLISEIAATAHEAGTPEQRVAGLYASYMDVGRLDTLGLAPIKADLDAVLAIETREQLARALAQPFISGPVGAGVLSDPGNPQRSIPAVSQADLTLPTRDFYLSEEEPYVSLRAALRAYVAETFTRAGIGDGAARADEIVALEIAMARAQWSLTDARDRVRMYHLMSPAELTAFAPGFDWMAFLDEEGFAGRTEIDVMTDTAVRDLARLWAETPIETWRSYLAFRLLDRWAGVLSQDWRDAHFQFHDRILSGLTEPPPREQEAVAVVGSSLGDDVGRLYVARYFPPEAKAAVETMIGYIRDAYRDRIANNAWMDAATRAEALRKLDRIVDHVGYPDRYLDYAAIRIDPADLVGNLRRIAEWEEADSLAQLDQPRRDWEWPYPAQEVNAGYVPSLNSITFPAGILQPPFFDVAADPAVNFGAIGAVVGHEIGHAFDDQGSRSDGDGRLRDWWTAASRAEFDQRAAVLVEQYNGYEPLPGVFVNGAFTLGENIGDLGGLTIAYEAYRRYVAKEEGGAATVIDGFTGDQRFFLSWAQLWRNVVTPEEARRRALSDTHSPQEFRVNGVVRNVDGWYEAFGVGEGDALYLAPAERVRIW